MSGTAVKRCTYEFETAEGRCCLADGHSAEQPHQLWRDDWVDHWPGALDSTAVTSLLRKESGPVSPEGAFLTSEQLSAIVAMRRFNRDSLWKAALEKHRITVVRTSDQGCNCVCGKHFVIFADWIEHVSLCLEDYR